MRIIEPNIHCCQIVRSGGLRLLEKDLASLEKRSHITGIIFQATEIRSGIIGKKYEITEKNYEATGKITNKNLISLS